MFKKKTNNLEISIPRNPCDTNLIKKKCLNCQINLCFIDIKLQSLNKFYFSIDSQYHLKARKRAEEKNKSE